MAGSCWACTCDQAGQGLWHSHCKHLHQHQAASWVWPRQRWCWSLCKRRLGWAPLVLCSCLSCQAVLAAQPRCMCIALSALLTAPWRQEMVWGASVGQAWSAPAQRLSSVTTPCTQCSGRHRSHALCSGRWCAQQWCWVDRCGVWRVHLAQPVSCPPCSEVAMLACAVGVPMAPSLCLVGRCATLVHLGRRRAATASSSWHLALPLCGPWRSCKQRCRPTQVAATALTPWPGRCWTTSRHAPMSSRASQAAVVARRQCAGLGRTQALRRLA